MYLTILRVTVLTKNNILILSEISEAVDILGAYILCESSNASAINCRYVMYFHFFMLEQISYLRLEMSV
jgi:hypothetical protein